MGLFDWLLGSSRQPVKVRDMIWLTKQAKFHGLVRSIGVSSGGVPDHVVLVAHFADTLELLRLIAEKGTGHDSIVAVMACDLSQALLQLKLVESQSVQIIVGERHPLLSKDRALLDLVNAQPCRCELMYHVSLEDPVLRAFAGEWVEKTLRSLGMTEDEAIESQMVARRIVDAQKRVAATSLSDVDTDSAEAWMERNCPQLVKK